MSSKEALRKEAETEKVQGENALLGTSQPLPVGEGLKCGKIVFRFETGE